MTSEVYHDNGRAFGNRTRVFRDAAGGGVEWMYGVDYANGDSRWYAFNGYRGPANTIETLKRDGMFLSRFESGPWPTELTPAGEQAVIPGCERNCSRTVRQLDLFG